MTIPHTSLEISAIDEFSRIIRRWWLIALLTILGGCLGWAFHIAQPPLYEAAATFSVVLDLSKSTPPLDEREQDQAIGAFKALMTATSVVEKVRAEALARDIPIDALDINRRVFIERRQSQIDLIIRNENPQTAAAVANLWADQAYAAMVAAHGHALQADSLMQYQHSLTECLQMKKPAPDSLCALESLDALEQRIQEVGAKRQAELLTSQSLLPTLVFDFSQRAEPPQEPVAYSAAVLLLAGALIGCVAGIALALIPWPGRKEQ
jgi:uncharacterized protein involved in exopolysaccharide biosynthesis